MLYDFAVSLASAFFVVTFLAAFSPERLSRRLLIAIGVLPLLLLAFNLLAGIYSRFRESRARTKTILLLTTIALSAGITSVAADNLEAPALWVLIVSEPLILARLLLNLNTGRHRQLARIADNRRGPVLVIGGAGYIGSHTVEVLLNKGHVVRVLDTLMYGDRVLAEFRDHSRFTLIRGHATDVAKLTAAMKDCSGVIHLAGLVGDPSCAVNSDLTRHTNIIATRIAREVAQAMGVHRFIFASSCSVYGVSDKEVAEVDELHPVSLYAQTKIDSERELLASLQDNFFVTVLRFATVFGHSRRPRFDLVGNLFTAQAVVDGHITVIGPDQWRPFIHVRDLARAIMLTFSAHPFTVQNQIFNVGDKRLNMTILDLAERIRAIVSRSRPVTISINDNPQDRRNYAVSFEKIRRILGFQAETLLDDGIEEIVNHFRIADYRHYRSPEYSNLEMTAKALAAFQDPAQMAHLYAPLKAS